MIKNYFNTLPFRKKLNYLGTCELMPKEKFNKNVSALLGKKIVIIGCGSQGLNQGLNMRDSNLDVSFVLQEKSIKEKKISWQNAKNNGFTIGTYEELIPHADLICNLTPDKQHSNVINKIIPLMKYGSTLSYSHGFNIVEEGMKIRNDITVIMVAPKSPGSEVRQEYKRGFGVPTLIAVHSENDPENKGWTIAKAYAVAIGGHRAGVLKSSFIAEVKSDLMGEQTILCGLLQSASILCFDKMIENNINPNYASKLIQYGWEVITEALKQGGITNMMDRLSNPAKIKTFHIAEELKKIMKPLFQKHQDDIISGDFSKNMIEDWNNKDEKLLSWRKQTMNSNFEKTNSNSITISEQEFFDNGILMVAFIKSGVELAYETMIETGIKPESAYYESLHETPLIANTIARKKLYEMNRIISDTAEYGCYLFDQKCRPLLKNFINKIDNNTIGKNFNEGKDNKVDNQILININSQIRSHSIEKIGNFLRQSMLDMKKNYNISS